jgi:hypothetical protein
MTKLEKLYADRLRATLEGAISAKRVNRLVIALAYKDGVDVGVLSDRYGIP